MSVPIKYSKLLTTDIKELQEILGVHTDGRYGSITKKKHLEELDRSFLDECEFYGWVWDPAPTRKTRERDFPKSPIAGTRVIWHWPSSGRSAESLGKLWRTDSRIVSSHAGVDEKEIRWYVMPHRVSFHAGNANGNSIGIDICSPPLTNEQGIKAAKDRGIYMGLTEDKKYQLLHPEILSKVSLVSRAIEIWADYKFQDHAFVDPGRKVDCIPWRNQLEGISCWKP